MRGWAESAAEQRASSPRVDAEAVRNYLTYLAVHRRVSASTQNQALSALLFLCRDVLGLNPEGLAEAPRAKRGDRLPVVLSIPETAALLSAMRGTPRIMARLIYGAGLRVLECCELRIKDIDFDQGLCRTEYVSRRKPWSPARPPARGRRRASRPEARPRTARQ